jgi:putative membrane protein
MRFFTILGLIAGLALFAGLLGHFGAAEVAAGAAAAGWGLVWIILYRFLTIGIHGLGWRTLFAPARPPAVAVFRARWIGEAMNSLLPVAQLGGDLARAQLAAQMPAGAAKGRVGGAAAGATVAVDFAVGLVAQLVFTVIGLALLIPWLGSSRAAIGGIGGWVAGLGLVVVSMGALFLAARSGWLGAIVRRAAVGRGPGWAGLAGGITAIEERTGELYRDRRALAACLTWRLLAWLLQSGETWLAMLFIGTPVSLPVALVLESLSSAVRSGAFMVPGGVGVQEGGFVIVGTLVGLPAETALALALVKRVRELAVGIPAVAVWSGSQSRRALAGSR